MNTSNSCPQCGAPLSVDASEALCPACLMSKALAETMKLDTAGLRAGGVATMPSVFPFDFGGYRVLSLLGRGGMGAVYEAQHKDSGRRVALKVLGHGMDTEELRKRFLREGRLAAAVSHPNSIYIFGTEEIEGAPVIVMEIAGGGTLKDELKKRGPLPVREAVDAMLQIIAGLEAAHAGGVLHRDVKPANCFLAPDGTAKVGDFGLSVSTLARQDTQITASGVLLGTPSFAPPEQLRGDELDVRADIYSAGATLYMLLTGRAPFEGEGAVQVVAAVLDKTPKPVALFRKDVPTGLEQVIARCMAKKREERFPSYASLRDALLPHSSQVPLPAPLGLRFLASMVDELITVLPETLLGFVMANGFADTFLTARTLVSFLPWLAVLGGIVAYYAVSEGLWGAGVGKALCGLRVIGPARSAPGLPRALVRALCWVLALNLPYAVIYFSTTAEDYQRWMVAGDVNLPWMLATFVMFLVTWLALFTTMRERNGYAAVHDLISGTRVVLRAKSAARPRLEAAATPLPPEHAERVGPYRVGQTMGDGWCSGYDEVLRRQVWIARRAGSHPPVTEARRAACRATRLRWIGGGQATEESWEAFEALQGRPLAALAPQSQGWAAVRHWLQDLTLELDAAEKDGTLPASLTLDHIWLTTDGRAVLLDEAWSASSGGAATFAVSGPESAQAFLHALLAQVLSPVTLPLRERDLLQKLAAGRFDRLSFIAGNLQSLLARPAVISRRRRAASLLLAPALIASCYLLAVVSLQHDERKADAYWRTRFPELLPLSQVMRLMNVSHPDDVPLVAWRPDEEMYQTAQVHIAGHYRIRLQPMLAGPPHEDPEVPLTEGERQLIKTVIEIQPEPSAEALARADATLQAELPVFSRQELRRPWLVETRVVISLLWGIAIVQVLALLAFGSSLGQRMFGFAVVNRKGEPASRLRLLARWCLGWLPLLVIIVGGAFRRRPPEPAELVVVVICAAVWLVAIAISILRPRQGVHDWLVRTWLVPR